LLGFVYLKIKPKKDTTSTPTPTPTPTPETLKPTQTDVGIVPDGALPILVGDSIIARDSIVQKDWNDTIKDTPAPTRIPNCYCDDYINNSGRALYGMYNDCSGSGHMEVVLPNDKIYVKTGTLYGYDSQDFTLIGDICKPKIDEVIDNGNLANNGTYGYGGIYGSGIRLEDF